MAALLLSRTGQDTSGVPPEQLVPLHTKACRGQGKSSTHHDRPRLTRPYLNTRVPKDNHGKAIHRISDKVTDLVLRLRKDVMEGRSTSLNACLLAENFLLT